MGPQGRCCDRRQTVNLVSAGGLVEQSNAEKNTPVGWLAASAAGWPAGCWLAGWLLLLLLLMAGWPAGFWLPGCLVGWLLASCCCLCWLAACCCWLADCAATAGWLADRLAKWLAAAAAGQPGWLLPAGRY